jgi:hypothetical protein
MHVGRPDDPFFTDAIFTFVTILSTVFHATGTHRHTPALVRLDTYIVPSFPNASLPQQELAGKGGELRVKYLLLVCGVHMKFFFKIHN